MIQIPLSKPHIPESVYTNLNQVLKSGKLSGDGFFCHKTEDVLKNFLNCKHVLLTSSGTHALEMSLLVLNAKQGDEVILPSFTFSSTANAVLVAGLKPIFCEIDPTTMNMDMNDVARKITDKTRAIIPVHYAGVACEMDKLHDMIQNKNIAIIEDAAHAIGATWRNKQLGTVGDIGNFSFHDTKNVVCGEGGAFITNNETFANQAMIIREKGTNRSQFLKGQVDKYTWVEKGSSYILAEPLAAILAAEVDIMSELNTKRQTIYNTYIESFKSLENKECFVLPTIPKDCNSNYHLFHMILPNENKRNALMAHLRGKGIGATFHYIPLHSAPMGETLGYKKADLPITEEYSYRLIRLPLYPDLNSHELNFIIEEIHNWCKSYI